MGFIETIKWWLWPSFPYSVLDVVFPDRIETYYEGVDEIRIHSSKKGYVITVVPRDARGDAPGPLSFVSSHDPWTVGALVTPFYLFRKSVLLWAVAWFMVIYMLITMVINTVFTPPGVEVYVPGYGKIVIPEPGWSPDPVFTSLSILGIGFLAMYYGFNILRFMQPIVKYSSLLAIGSVSGVHYVVPAPEPLTTLKVSDFLRLLGYKFYVFELETVETLMGTLTAVLKENRALREQTIECLEGYRRLTQTQDVAGDIITRNAIVRLATSKPLLFMLLILGPFLIGALFTLMVTGGVTIEPVSTNHTAIHP